MPLIKRCIYPMHHGLHFQHSFNSIPSRFSASSSTPRTVTISLGAWDMMHEDKTARDTIVETEVAGGTVRPKLERYLNFLPALFFSATLQASWESIGGGLQAGLLNGGPVGLVYGLILSIIGTVAIASSLAELASITPVAGGQYHWTYQFAPFGRKFLSMMQGWITVFAAIATATIAPFLIGTQIQGLAVLLYDDYTPQRWHGTLIMWAILIPSLIVNIFARRLLPVIELLFGTFHLVFFPVTIITMIVMGPRNPSDFVWKEFVTDFSGWNSDGIVWCVGLLTAIFPMTGFDGILHLSEETRQASVAIPRAMVWGVWINGVLTFGYLIAVLYTMGPLEAALETPTGYPIIEIYYQAAGRHGCVALMTLSFVVGFAALFNIMAAVSRLTWAFARDEGLPFSTFFAYVSPSLKIPLRALILDTAIIVLISLINIGSTTAFYAVLSLATLAVYISYVIPIICLVCRRFDPEPIPWGPYCLGRWGLPINVFAITFGMFIIVFLPFPPILPVTKENMNYSGPVMGAVLLFAVVDWFVRGRKRYHGPTVKIGRHHLEARHVE